MIKRRLGMLLLLLLAMPAFVQGAVDNEADVWSALRAGGHVILMRHAVTEPGIGDPPGFVLADCRTQRNLSTQGRSDARRIGEAFRQRSIPVSEVLSSRWCRCLDTARLAFGRATPAAPLDSMFNDDENTIRQKIREVHTLVSQRPVSGNLVLVTHNRNIDALTGISVSSGEMVVVVPDGAGTFRVIGRLSVPAP